MIIYKTTNLINGKIYIGQDSNNNEHYYGSGTLVKRAFKKYGKEMFVKEILSECYSIEELNKLEKFWIKFYNSTDKKIGYNILNGGAGDPKNHKGHKWSKNSKRKLSESLKGRIFSEEHKRNISKNHADVSGSNNPMYGKKHSIEVVEKLRDINIGKKHTKETRDKVSKATIGENNPNSSLIKSDVYKIRELYFKENFLQKEIAILFNVKQTCISKIVTYRTWKHI